jgi:hypothetical protein
MVSSIEVIVVNETHAPDRAMDQKIAFRWVLKACRRVIECSEASAAAASRTASIPISLTISSSALVNTFSDMVAYSRKQSQVKDKAKNRLLVYI